MVSGTNRSTSSTSALQSFRRSRCIPIFFEQIAARQSNRSKKMTDKQQKFSLAPHSARPRALQVTLPIKELVQIFEEDQRRGIDLEDLEPIYVYPTTVNLGGLYQEVPGSNTAELNAIMSSCGYLRKSQMESLFSVLRKMPKWTKLFKIVENKEHNPNKLPIYIFSGDGYTAQWFVNQISLDLLRLVLENGDSDE